MDKQLIADIDKWLNYQGELPAVTLLLRCRAALTTGANLDTSSVPTTPETKDKSQDAKLIATIRKIISANWTYYDDMETLRAAADRIEALSAVQGDALDALRAVMQLVSDAVLVRNTAGDEAPDWALKQLPLILTLKRAQAIIDAATLAQK